MAIRSPRIPQRDSGCPSLLPAAPALAEERGDFLQSEPRQATWSPAPSHGSWNPPFRS